MSEVMLHGVLNMPSDLWNDNDELDKMQRHSRYVEASELIRSQEEEISLLRYNLMEIRGMIRPIITNSQQILIEATENKNPLELGEQEG